MNKKTNNISNQVMWNRLISVVEEQAQALIRTAFSTSVREAGDLSAGVYNSEGEMLAQAVTGTPGHVNAMADSVGHFIKHIGRKNGQKHPIACGIMFRKELLVDIGLYDESFKAREEEDLRKILFVVENTIDQSFILSSDSIQKSLSEVTS